MHSSGEERWVQALQEHAAHLAFADWQAGPDDWTSLYTNFDDEDAPMTEVAVYRGHERIHFRRYTGSELTQFWTRLVNAVSE